MILYIEKQTKLLHENNTFDRSKRGEGLGTVDSVHIKEEDAIKRCEVIEEVCRKRVGVTI